MIKGRSLAIVLFGVGVALSVSRAGRLQDNYELGLRTQLFTAALVEGRSRDIYWMFCPQFRAEHSLARFDSALADWFDGRQVRRANRKVVDISGAGGFVSTWVVFEGKTDYDYVYQSWLRVGRTWQLVWISRVLDNSFRYGVRDTAAVRGAVTAALDYALSSRGLARFGKGLVRPETTVVVKSGLPGESAVMLPGTRLLWLDSTAVRARLRAAPARFVLGLSGVRILGEMATVTVDWYPTEKADAGRFGTRRGLQVYLSRKKDRWEYHSVGKTW